MMASQPSGGPKQDGHRWDEEVVWPTVLPEGVSLVDLSLVTRSGKLAPVGLGKEASMSSAGENAECPWFGEEKDLLHPHHSRALTREGVAVCPATSVSGTCSVAH